MFWRDLVELKYIPLGETKQYCSVTKLTKIALLAIFRAHNSYERTRLFSRQTMSRVDVASSYWPSLKVNSVRFDSLSMFL